jgi:hypothetical protein
LFYLCSATGDQNAATQRDEARKNMSAHVSDCCHSLHLSAKRLGKRDA